MKVKQNDRGRRSDDQNSPNKRRRRRRNQAISLNNLTERNSNPEDPIIVGARRTQITLRTATGKKVRRRKGPVRPVYLHELQQQHQQQQEARRKKALRIQQANSNKKNFQPGENNKKPMKNFEGAPKDNRESNEFRQKMPIPSTSRAEAANDYQETLNEFKALRNSTELPGNEFKDGWYKPSTSTSGSTSAAAGSSRSTAAGSSSTSTAAGSSSASTLTAAKTAAAAFISSTLAAVASPSTAEASRSTSSAPSTSTTLAASSTSTAAPTTPRQPSIAPFIPSQELIWTRDSSGEQQQLEPMTPPGSFSKSLINIDDEIEEGEIVEREVVEIVDLLQQSMYAVENSRKSNIFFEDRLASVGGKVPIYNTINDPVTPDASDDVICLDSSVEKSQLDDDSVIFVGEEKSTPKSLPKLTRPNCLNTPAIDSLLDLIAKPNKSRSSKAREMKRSNEHRKTYEGSRRSRKRQKLNALIHVDDDDSVEEVEETPEKPEKPSTSEASIEKAPTPPDATAEPPNPPEKQKRIILIDGSNVAMQHSTDNQKGYREFSAEGLKICIDHFESMGFQVKAVVPEYRVVRDKSTNHKLMNSLKNKGKLTLTPRMSYDDRVILEGALRLDAAVVSNDFYRDMVQEKPEFKNIVNSRLIRFNWMFGKLIIPEDPYGRNGPKLDDILYK